MINHDLMHCKMNIWDLETKQFWFIKLYNLYHTFFFEKHQEKYLQQQNNIFLEIKPSICF